MCQVDFLLLGGTQGVCLNSELDVLSLDFSEPRCCADTIGMD